jgi:hypothetical protein
MAAGRAGGTEAFRVGSVLGRTFAIWARNIVPFAILTLIIYSPLVVYAVAAVPDPDRYYTSTTGSNEEDLEYSEEELGLRTREFGKAVLEYSVVLLCGGYILGLIAAGAFVYGVFEQLRGHPAGLGACLRVGLSRLLPVVVVGILAGIATLLGFVLLVIPGIVIMCMYWLAVPVAVVERRGLGSLGRSAQLTDGNKGAIFGILLVLVVTERVADFAIEKALGPDPGTAGVFLPLIVTLAFGSLKAVASGVAYHDLRVAKEGVATEDLVRVFA